VKEKADTSVVNHEIPQILVQAVLAYEKNPSLDNHTAFAVRVNGTVLQLSMAVIHHTYMEELYQGKPLNEGLTLFRSESYDLREPDRRREVVRIFIGLIRRLYAGWFCG
jgi:hypothetical protein